MSKKRKRINFSLEPISAMNEKQKKVLSCRENQVLIGSAGTGKTFLATYLGLKEVLDERSDITKLVFFRSAVPTRDIGFLPGNEKEKMEVYTRPYKLAFRYTICDDITIRLYLLNDKNILDRQLYLFTKR